ncbi:MAG: hypothetical protein ACK47B_13595 [Armatimonadota bacterium]
MNPSTLHRRALLLGAPAALLGAAASAAPRRPRRVAGVVTVYHHNSHADVILSRLFQTKTLDFKGRKPDLQLAALYVDQFPENDLSRKFAREYGFPIYPNIRETLTLGGDRLAVDGVILVGEHGKYPHSPQGHELYPRKRFFDETVEVFRKSKRSVSVFTDKHLSHSWEESREMYDTARELGFPLMAGSSVPLTWRRPPVAPRKGAPLREAVAVSYHTLYGYGFHAMEMLQCVAEQRKGGESGIRRVQCLEGPAVWEAGRQGRYDRALLQQALGRLSRPVDDLEKAVPNPTVFLLEYRDGFKASVFTLNPAVGEWSIAWREEGKEPEATLFWTQEARPFYHFTLLLNGIEEMIHTGRPSWPVERTLLTSGALDALLHSRHGGGTAMETPHLAIRYRPTWSWTDPGPPPPGRPINEQ